MSRLSRLAALAAVVLPTAAYAQHANFVLFGTDNPAAEQTKEQKFVHPLTVPYYNEDSFVTTDARAWFAYHKFPEHSLIGGGHATDYALQLRLALTDTIQFVAYKDGYLDLNSRLVDEGGWNDVAAGIKWNFIQNWKDQFHMAVGVGYELPVGDAKVLQNDQELRVWGSVNKGFDKFHLGLTVNGLFQLGSADALGNSDRLIWNLHADYHVCDWFSPVVEMNGIHVLNKNKEVLPFSGADVADLGGGDDVITLGVGGEFRITDNIAARAAYELPLTDGEDLYGWRVTASVVWSF
ncbi:MAG: hypothetical protein QM754_01940 [Tepidisphaeraceae bacterium]